jgi:hypothetical protein
VNQRTGCEPYLLGFGDASSVLIYGAVRQIPNQRPNVRSSQRGHDMIS